MSDVRMSPIIKWYRTPITRIKLKKLTKRSDLKGLIYTLAYLGLLTVTGTLIVVLTGKISWLFIALLLVAHGTSYSFMINGFHELSHGTVFRSKWLNEVFLRIFSFLGWYSHIGFRASHTRHHAYTLHPPDDMEVVLPVKYELKSFLVRIFVDPIGLFHTIRTSIRIAMGRLDGEWQEKIFADESSKPGGPEDRRRHIRWYRILLSGHVIIVVIAVMSGLWMLPVVISAGRFYFSCLFYLCNSTQHVGLVDNIDDFRLCCRTHGLNPIVRFLYWQMNYHTEHHMYAAVPFYNLRALHNAIQHDMPPILPGLVSTWKQIVTILKRQKNEPTYQYYQPLPKAKSAIAQSGSGNN